MNKTANTTWPLCSADGLASGYACRYSLYALTNAIKLICVTTKITMICRLMIVFIFFLLSSNVFSQATISGKIYHYDGKSEIYYSHSWKGIHPLIGQSIKPSASGNFNITLNPEELGKVNFRYKQFRSTLFFTDNATIEIVFDENDPTSFSVRGDLEVINHYYHTFSTSMKSPLISVSGNEHSKFIAKLQTPELVVHTLDSMMQQEIDRVYAEKPIDLEGVELDWVQLVTKHLINEIKAYYGIVFLNAMFLKKQQQLLVLHEDTVDTLEIYNSRWQNLIESFTHNISREIEPMPNSPYYNELLRMHSFVMQTYKEYDFQQPMSIDEDIYHKLVGFDSLLFNDDKSVLAYQLNYLNTFLGSDFYYSPALLDITNQLKSEHPNVSYWPLLEPNIKKLKGSIIAAGKKYKEAEIIKTNYTTFKDLINQFSGSYLYVDIWATWCLPCIKDFQYKDEISSFMEPEVQRLYISIDQQRFAERWQQSIKYNELKGYHVRANNELIEDMWNSLGGIQGAIPRYVLIDKSGNIFKSMAASPSHQLELRKQIEAMLSEDSNK